MPSRRCNETKRLRFILFLLTFLSAAVALPAQEKIEWEPVEGADHYRIEIRQDGKLILETRSDKPRIPLFLPPGEYDFLVKVINTFGKIASVGEWSLLKITVPDIPFIIDFLPMEIHEGGETVFRTRVSGLVSDPGESTVFMLEDTEGKQLQLESELSATTPEGQNGDWKEVILKARRQEPGQGLWTLVMTNPDGRENRMGDALVVLDRLRPRIRKFNPKKIPAGEVHNTAVLEITGMESGAIVEFSGPSEFQATLLKKSDDGILEYSLNLQDVETGWYSVRITNPSGDSDYKEKVFEVLPAEPTPEEIAAANALKIDDREPRPIPEFPRSVFGGWHFTLPVGSTSEYFNNGYAGLSLGFSQKIQNDLIRRIPGFGGFAWDFTFSYSHNKTTFPLIEINLNRYIFLLGLNYTTSFDFPLNLIVRAGGGFGFSIYTSPDYSRDEWLGPFALRDLDSLDFIVRFGIGARYDINTRWYVDLTCDFSATFYMSRTAWSIQPRLEGGWRW